MNPHIFRLHGTRIASTQDALDKAVFLYNALVLRLAPDELFVQGNIHAGLIPDPHAIVQADAGFVGCWLSASEAGHFLAHHCEWEIPQARPAFAQGMVAGLPMKLWFEYDRVLLVVSATVAQDLQERLSL